MSARPEISFNALVVSLATSTAVHLGDAVDPSSGRRQRPNLEAAGHMLDLLVVLAEKTKGNLEEQEATYLEQLTAQLREAFVKISAGAAGAEEAGAAGAEETGGQGDAGDLGEAADDAEAGD